MLNIATLAAASTAAIHLKSADGQPLYSDGKPVRIIVHGPGTRAYSAIEARQTARALKRMNENEGKMTAATAEEQLAETAEDLASLTIEFENLTYDAPGYSGLKGDELFRAVYSDPALGFVAKQVRKFVADWGNFNGASPTT